MGMPSPLDDFWYLDASEIGDFPLRVTPETSKKFSAYWAATNLYAKPISSFDRAFQKVTIETYGTRSREIFENDRESHLWRIFELEVNPHTSTTEWLYESIDHYLNWGNSFDLIDRRNKRIEYLWKIHPSRIPENNILELTQKNIEDVLREFPGLSRRRPELGEYIYKVEADPKDPDQQQMIILERDILHIKHCPANGYGQGVHKLGKAIITRHFSADKYEQDFFDNGGFNSIVATYPEGIDESKKRAYRESIKTRIGVRGPRSQEPLFMEYGSDAKALSISPEAAQLIQTKNYNVQDMARLYGVPMHLLSLMENTSYNSIEQQFSEYMVIAIQPTAKHFCLEWRRQLLSRKMQVNRRFHMNVKKDLFLADLKSYAEYLHKLFQTAAVSPNDICEAIDMNPFGEEGETRYAQVNVQTLEHFKLKEKNEQAKVDLANEKVKSMREPKETSAEDPTENPNDPPKNGPPVPTESEETQRTDKNNQVVEQAKMVTAQSLKNTLAYHNRMVSSKKMSVEDYRAFQNVKVKNHVTKAVDENAEMLSCFLEDKNILLLKSSIPKQLFDSVGKLLSDGVHEEKDIETITHEVINDVIKNVFES